MKAFLTISLILLLIIQQNAQTSDNTKCWQAAGTTKCIFCRASYSGLYATSTWGLMMTKGKINGQTLAYKGTDPNDLSFNCYPNTPSLNYTCTLSPIDKCEIYDFYGKCIRCACNFAFWPQTAISMAGGEPQSKMCVENSLRVHYCDEYDIAGQCIRCKWNQAPGDEYDPNFFTKTVSTSADMSSQIFVSGERNMLDFGLWNQICYDNTAWKTAAVNPNTNAVSNCKLYDSSMKTGNPNCQACHSRDYNFHSNSEWNTPFSSTTFSDDNWKILQNNYQKIHWDYILSSTTTSGVTTTICKRYPTHYIGYPKDLFTVAYYADTNNKGAYQIDPSNLKSACQSNLIFVTQCGYPIGGTSCATTSDNDFVTCAKKITNCKKYILSTVTNYDRLGQQQTTTTAQFIYKIVTQCEQCDDTYVLSPDGQTCTSIDPQKNQNCKVAATSDLSSCATCLTGTLYLTTTPGSSTTQIYKCATITAITNCASYYLSGTSYLCSKCNLGYARSKDDDRCVYLGTRWIAALQSTFLFGCGKLTNAADANIALTPTSASCSLNTDISAGGCADGFTQMTSGNNKYCQCSGGLSVSSYVYCQPLPTASAPASIINPVLNCTQTYNNMFMQCKICVDSAIRSDSWKECILKLAAPDDGNCISYTSQGSCRYCKFGFFLDQNSLTCKVDKDTTNYNKQVIACAFGKLGTKSDFTVDSKTVQQFLPTCTACQIGYTLVSGACKSRTIVDLSVTPTKWCVNFNAATGLCSDCPIGTADVWAVPSTPSADDNIPVSALYRMCGLPIANCKVLDSSLLACMQCDFKGNSQLGVAKDGTCQTCTAINQIGLSYDGKQVCVTTVDANCIVYGYDGLCAECKANQNLYFDGTCKADCTTGLTGFKTGKIFNDYKEVAACVPADGQNTVNFATTTENTSPCMLWSFASRVLPTASSNYKCNACNINFILKPTASAPPVYSCLKVSFLDDSCNLFSSDYNTCDNTPTPTGVIPICKPTDTSSVATFFKSDYGFMCSGTSATTCANQCSDNSLGGVPNCFSYFDTTKQSFIDVNSIKDKCCMCKKGYQPQAGAASCGITSCTKNADCTLYDSNDNCLQCATNYKLQLSDTTGLRTCVQTCSGTSISIFTGYAIIDGCLPTGITLNQFKDSTLANCGLWYIIPNTGTKLSNANALQCIKCITGKILTPNAFDLSTYVCNNDGVGNGQSNVPTYIGQADAKCSRVSYLSLSPAEKYPECLIISAGDKNTDYTKDYGLTCKGSDAAQCVQQCIDNKNNVPNCKSYITTLTTDTQFVAAETGLTNKCCQCKTGFFKEDDQTTAEDKNCGISSCKQSCMLQDSKGLCAQCTPGFKLTTDRKCKKDCPGGTTAKKAFMADIYQQVDVCVDVSKAQTNYDANGATNCAVYSFPLESVTDYTKIFCLQCADKFNLLKISDTQYTCTSNDVAKFASCNIVVRQCEDNSCITAGADNGFFCQGGDNTNCIGKCVSNQGLVANCKTYCKGVTQAAAGKCCQCQDGYVGDQATSTTTGSITSCTPTYPNCISLDDSSPQLCAKCADTFSLTETRTCVSTATCTTQLKAVVQITSSINIVDVPVCLKVNQDQSKLTNTFLWKTGFNCGIVNLIRVKDEAGLASVKCIECQTTTQILTPTGTNAIYQCQEPNANNQDTNNLIANARASKFDSTQTANKQALDKQWFTDVYATSEICKSNNGYQQNGGKASCESNVDKVPNCATYVPESQLGSQATNTFPATAGKCCRCQLGFKGDQTAADNQATTCNIATCSSQVPDNCAKFSKGLCHMCKDNTFYLDQTLQTCKNANGIPASTTKLDTSVVIRSSPFPQSTSQNAFVANPPTNKIGALYEASDTDLNKDLCSIFSFDPATQTATSFDTIGCVKCKANYVLTKVTGKNSFQCVYDTQISTTCATASATYLCDGTLWKTGTTYGKDVVQQQPCGYDSAKNYQFVAQNIQNGQCAEQTAVAKCASYYPQTGTALQSTQFDIAIANLAGKCCMCKNQFIATGTPATCTITACDVAEATQSSVCVSWIADSKTSTSFICNQCAAGYKLTLSRQCVKTCPNAKDGTAGGQGWVFVPGNTDFVDGCVFTAQTGISATNFIYQSTAVCKTFMYPGFVDPDNNYNLNLLCYACDQFKPQILYQTKKFQTSATDNTQSTKTAWRCLDQSVLEMGTALKDKQTGMRFLPTKPMCDERAGQANFQCIPYVSGNTNYGDYAYVQNSANGLAMCIQNTATPASTTNVIPNCKSYYIPQTQADGTGYTIADDRVALLGKCNECQKGYIEQRSNEGKITACTVKCLVWDVTEKFCVQCPTNQFLQFDGTCVATCDVKMKAWAWTGYYTMVAACFDNTKLTKNSKFTLTVTDSGGNSVASNPCSVWNFGPVAKPQTAVTGTSIDSVQCYSCGEGNMLSVDKNGVYSCLPIADYYFLNFNNNFCSTLDTASTTVSKAQKGNCQIDSCRNESIASTSANAKFVSIDYGYVKDSQNGNPVLGRCTKNDDYVPHCLTYISASKNLASADLTKKLCCACKQGYWPVLSTDVSLATSCNILKCQRHQNAQIADSTQNCLAWQFSDKSAIKIFQDSTAQPAIKTNCGFCAIGYFNNDDDLVKCVAPSTIPSFACQYIKGNVCVRCFEPQVLIGSTCVDKVDKCIQYSGVISAQNTGTCTQCEWPYYLNIDKKCILSLHGCAEMYQSDAEYDIFRPKCKNCMENWYNSEGLCYYGCARVKKLWSNTTKTYQAQCCTCLITYRMADDKGTCQACISNCANCTTSVTACDMCTQGYFYNKLVTPFVCQKQDTIATCLTYSITVSGQCASCQSGNFLSSNGVCSPYTTVDNCITYNPNVNQCTACTKRQYYINSQFQCVKYIQVCFDGDDGFNTNADQCLKCPLSGRENDKTVYYYLQNGLCKTGTIINCVQYNQTANQMICTKCDDSNLGYGLDSAGANCLDNTLTKAGGTPHCYQYNPQQGSSPLTCKLCADPTAVSQNSYVLVSNEQDVSKACQQISYCLSAFKQRKAIDSLTEIYNCSLCASKVGSTNIYGNLKLKSGTIPTPDTTQCQQESNGVRNCRAYLLADGDDHASNCIGCQNGYTPEQGGKVCKPNDLFCESKGCLNYVSNTNYEWIKCALCSQFYFGNDNQNNSLSLNYATQRCDLNTTSNDGAYTYPPGMQFNIGSNGTDGGLAPTFTPSGDGGTGKDGGTNPTNPETKPSTFASFTSIGFETLLIVILGFLAFII